MKIMSQSKKKKTIVLLFRFFAENDPNMSDFMRFTLNACVL